MTAPVEPPADHDVVGTGMTLRRTWTVWSNQVAHVVDVRLNGLMGSARVSVDGTEMARSRTWRWNPNGYDLPFDVDGRPCLLVVRTRYGSQASFELYSDGRSLSTGEELARHRAAESRELPGLVRMLLIFIPLIGGFNTVVQQRDSLKDVLGGWGSWILLGFALAVAGAGWWLASRWYARGPEGAQRHLVGGTIVAVAWTVFFAGFIGVLLLRPS